MVVAVITRKCIFNDQVNEVIAKAQEVDGLIVGSPVHYAAASGMITAFMDRLFYASNAYSYKPGAAVTVARRAGTVSAFDQLNKYFTINKHASCLFAILEYGFLAIHRKKS